MAVKIGSSGRGKAKLVKPPQKPLPARPPMAKKVSKPVKTKPARRK